MAKLLVLFKFPHNSQWEVFKITLSYSFRSQSHLSSVWLRHHTRTHEFTFHACSEHSLRQHHSEHQCEDTQPSENHHHGYPSPNVRRPEQPTVQPPHHHGDAVVVDLEQDTAGIVVVVVVVVVAM